MDFSFGALTLAASFLTTASLAYYAFTPPNPMPAKAWPKDSLMRYQGPRQRNLSLTLLFLGWFYHIFLILFPPSSPSILCPHPSQLDPKFFIWSPYTTLFILLIYIAAPIRLLAFKQLGQNFTFMLARPKKLITTGMYTYVRHPSYPTLLVCHIASGALIMRSRGITGCWLPAWLAQWSFLDVGVVLFPVINLCALLVRVREEEEMLKSEFGEEYKAYARRTKRFLPWII